MCLEKGNGVEEGCGEQKTDKEQLGKLSLEKRRFRSNLTTLQRRLKLGEELTLPSSKWRNEMKCPQGVPGEV